MNYSTVRRRLVLGMALVATFNLGVFARPFIDELRRPDPFDLLETTARISQPGVAAAPRVFVAFDPYCSFCHKLYQSLALRVESGDVQVEWVPVAFMNADSASVAAEMLTATDPSIALSRWFGAEIGTSPVIPKGANPTEVEASVSANTALVRGLVGRNAAPAVFYRDKGGVMQLTVGLPSDIDGWLKSLSS